MRIQLVQDIIDKLRGKEKDQRLSPDPEVKREIIRGYANAHQCRVFVETGTFEGDTVEAMKPQFEKLISIELDQALFEAATKRFSPDAKVTILLGDSGVVIEEVLKDLDQKALFWLDGHYSGGFTAKADLNTPVMKEIAAIAAAKPMGHVILIDDARCFGTESDYPTIEELRLSVSKLFPDSTFELADDIIRIIPN